MDYMLLNKVNEMVKRRGLGKGLGKGYKNLVTKDPYIHGLSAKGIKSKLPQVIKKKDYWINIQESGEARPEGIIVDVFDYEDELLDTYPIMYMDFDWNKNANRILDLYSCR